MKGFLERSRSICKILVLSGLVGSSAAYAVSFNCDKASSAVEKSICSDPNLGKLDDDLSENYKMMRAANIGDGAKKDLSKTQREWLVKRNACGDKKCIEVSYKQRIDAVCEYPVLSGAHPVCTASSIEPQVQAAKVNVNKQNHAQPSGQSQSAPSENQKLMPIRPAECYGYMAALFEKYVPNESASLASMKPKFVAESKRIAPQVDFKSGAFMGEMEFRKLDITQKAETSKQILSSCLELRNRIAN